MNQWRKCWLVVAAPAALLACGSSNEGAEPEAHAGDGTGATTATAGSVSGGASGAATTSGGTAGSSAGGASGATTAAAGEAGSGAAPAGGMSGTGAGDAGAGGEGAGPSTALELLGPVVKAFCAAARACCKGPDLTVDLDGCEASFPEHDVTFAAVDAGTATIDQTGLAACIEAYRDAATKCEELPVLSACQGLVRGVKKAGESCAQVGECAHGSEEVVACIITDQLSNRGLCSPVSHGKLGDPCLTTCELGAACSVTSYVAADASTATLCFEQDGLHCSVDDGRCAAIKPIGDPCTFDDCGSANYCDTMCKKRSILGQSCAQTCLSSLQCVNDQCVSPSFTIGGTCSGQWFGPY